MSHHGFFHFSGAGWVVAGAMLAGCSHAPAPGPARAEGRGTFEFVRPPAAPESGDLKIQVKEPLTKDELVAPRPLGELAEPVYPAVALAGRAGPVTVGVRILVDVEGKVADVSQSILSFSTPTPWAAEFRAAVEEAAKQWRFRPGEVRHFTTVTNAQGTYRSMTGSEPTEWALHVAFTFNATGGMAVETKTAGAAK